MTRYTADELRKLREEGRGRTDWSKVDATSDDALEALIDEDAEERATADNADLASAIDWREVALEGRPRKKSVHLRLDEDVLSWFRETGKGYQTRMNAVLRTYYEQVKSAGRRADR